MKCINLNKYFRSHPHTLCRPPAQGIFNKQLTHSEGAGGGPPPEREGPQRRFLPPLPDIGFERRMLSPSQNSQEST